MASREWRSPPSALSPGNRWWTSGATPLRAGSKSDRFSASNARLARRAAIRLYTSDPPRGDSEIGRSLREADPSVEAPERAWCPPVPLSEELHQRRHEKRADDARVDQHSERRSQPVLLDEDDLRGDEGADRDGEEEGSGGDDAPRALEPDRDGFRVGGPAIASFLDPREQEDPVVGGESERDREQEQRHRLLERALARVAEEPLEAPVLEDEYEDPEDRAQG